MPSNFNSDSITQTLIVPFPSEGGEVSLCVAVGYKSGYIKIFSQVRTDLGILLTLCRRVL